MLFINNNNEHDPAVNLALEEYVIRQTQTYEDLLLLYINEPSIIIGHHQNTFEEINASYVEQHGIYVVRRLSGGGAVYHDLGNLNFSFITESRPENFRNFKKFTEPVIQALVAMGIPAELSGRSDLRVGGRKISGNAQYISRGRMVSHGTLLFNADLSRVREALKVEEGIITSKGVKSVRSQVANISEFLSQPMTVEVFRAHLLSKIFSGADPIPEYPLGSDDWDAIRQLADERYRTWEWNYGHSPDFTVEKRQRFPGGEIEARLEVQQGIIRSARFQGDFFTEVEPEALARALVGVRYSREEILHALQHETIEPDFPGLDLKMLGAFLC